MQEKLNAILVSYILMNKEGGFTVLELVVTIGLIGLVIPVVFITTNSLMILNKRSRNITIANIAAENKIESLRSNGYNSIPSGNVTFTNELPNELPSPKSATFSSSTDSGKKTIDISISYKDYNQQRTVRYKTIISETGLGQ